MPLTTSEIQVIITICGIFFSVGGAYGVIRTKNIVNDKKFEKIELELCRLSNKIEDHKKDANTDDAKIRSDVLIEVSDFKKTFSDFKERFFQISESIIERIHTLELQTVKKSDCIRQIKDCHLDSQGKLADLKSFVNSINEDFKRALQSKNGKYDDNIPKVLNEIKKLNDALQDIKINSSK